MNTQVNEEIQRRIIGAADALYSDDSTSFPTVDAVRRRARANMADTVSVMREWRRGKSPTQSSVSADVPEKLCEMARHLLANLWLEAQAASNENLRTAHLGWELERQEAEAVRQQVTAAFDDQASELDTATRRINELETSWKAALERVADLESQVEALVREHAVKVAAHDAKEQQFKQRIADLKFAVSQGRTTKVSIVQKRGAKAAAETTGNGRVRGKDAGAKGSERSAGRRNGTP